MSDRRSWVLGVLGFAVLFLATAHWWGSLSVDTQAADYASWRLVHTGSLDLSGVPDLPDDPFFVRSGSQIIPDRTMGIILLGVPLQAVLAPLQLSPDTPGVLTAVICAAVTLANMALVFRRMGGGNRTAIAAASVLGLGTAVWTVAASELWSHTASLLFLSAILVALSRDRLGWAAIWVTPLVWSRPHLAVVPAAIGVWLLLGRRRLRPAGYFAVSGVFAFAALLLWNNWVYGHPSLTGPYYGGYVGTRLKATGGSATSAWFGNLLGAAFSPLRGVFLYSPVVALALVCLVYGWRRCPSWAQGATVGGFAYQAVQFKLNGFSGGTAFFGNRVVLELLLLCAPAAYVGYTHLVTKRPGIRPLARSLAAASVAIHATGAILAGAAPNYGDPSHAWHTWLLLEDVRSTAPAGVVVLAFATLIAAGIAARGPLTRAVGLSPGSGDLSDQSVDRPEGLRA